MLLWLAIACAPDHAAAPAGGGGDPSRPADTASAADDTDSGPAPADDTGDDTAAPETDCPDAAHDPAAPVDEADYDAYPVYIAGTDRRFTTIQNGIWGAEDGDVVTVCPGTYHERIDFKGKPITVRSAGGPAVTTLDAQREGTVVSLRNYEPPESVLEGFTITGGEGDERHGGGVFVEYGSPTIRYNIVLGNRAGIGGGVYVRNGAATVHNNVIAWNEGQEGGGGYVCTACRGSFRYNTVFWNRSRQGPVFEFYWGVADVIGNVLVAEEGSGGHAVRLTSVREGIEHTVAYNLLWPESISWAPEQPEGFPQGEAWVRAAPLLVDVEAGDWTLGGGSPAIDAGPPDALDPDGTRADLGAFGGPDGAWPW